MKNIYVGCPEFANICQKKDFHLIPFRKKIGFAKEILTDFFSSNFIILLKYREKIFFFNFDKINIKKVQTKYRPTIFHREPTFLNFFILT